LSQANDTHRELLFDFVDA